MFLNRGNHEAKEMNRTYGFEGEAKHKHGEQTYKVWDTWPYRNMLLSRIPPLALCLCVYHQYCPLSSIFAWISPLTAISVPLATLVSATRPPTETQNVILSPEGVKRYFVTHGGLFSKDGVTLDEIRKINRIGRQPGTEGLMCTLLFLFVILRDLNGIHRRSLCFKLFTVGG
jgi:serine/threonine-protein phosphatase 5